MTGHWHRTDGPHSLRSPTEPFGLSTLKRRQAPQALRPAVHSGLFEGSEVEDVESKVDFVILYYSESWPGSHLEHCLHRIRSFMCTKSTCAIPPS